MLAATRGRSRNTSAPLRHADRERLRHLEEIADRCATRPALAVRAAERIGSRLRELPEFIDPAVLRSKVTTLSSRGDLPPPWRDLLAALRSHPDPDVRDDAYSVDMS